MNAPVALALAAGMIAAINPCGFSLLPAYIGFFVTGDEPGAGLDRRLLGAVTAASGVTAGFIAVFVALGIVLDTVLRQVRPHLPWVTLTVGVVVIVAGAATVVGWRFRLPTLRLAPRRGRSPLAVVSFGVVYGLVSLSCTIGPFLAITSVALDRSLVGGVVTYASYGLGMGVVILVLSAGAAIARPGPALGLRLVSRYAVRIGGVVMVASGVYAVSYARWQLAVYGGDLSGDPLVDRGERFRVELVGLIDRMDPVRIAVVVGASVTATVLLTRRRREA